MIKSFLFVRRSKPRKKKPEMEDHLKCVAIIFSYFA
jgi:hypothetical protein